MGQRGVRTPPAVVECIVAAYKAGEKLTVIAAEYHVSTETVVRYARMAGMRRGNVKGKPGRPGPRILSPEQVAEIREWHRQRRALGTYATLAKKYNVSVTLIERIVRHSGYPPAASSEVTP